jgi:murein L,D-transpeptidase YcbB/YkuD
VKLVNSYRAALIVVFCLALLQGRGVAQPGTTGFCAAVTQSDLCPIIEGGQLSDLHWPNFSDLRTEVRDFYLPFDYTLAWTKDGRPTTQARTLIQLLQDADKKGLRADDYDGPFWEQRIARLEPPAPQASAPDLARFDLALTVSAMRYVSALRNGRINPRSLQLGLDVEHKRFKLGEFLRSRLVEAQDVKSVVEQVEPSYAGYRRTRAALEHYLALERQGEGDPLPAFAKNVKPGEAYPGLKQLAQRLQLLGDLPQQTADATATAYQGMLVDAIKHFQKRHGLPANGIIDRATFNQLTTPLSRRIVQLQLTLERWRWLPPDLPQRLIAVNVPEFQLRAFDDHHPSLAMRVVVGKAFPEHQTPVFEDEVKYLIFRPYWNVPIGITRKELIPEIKKNPAYLEKHGFEVVNHKGQAVSGIADRVVLARLNSGVYEIRQKPGPGNSLGLIKFVFPNNYDVYLHGTPERALFAHSQRAFSHGCIRIENPEALAAWVLRDDPAWTDTRIQAAMNATDPTRVKLLKPIPVLVLYGTALVDENEEVHFFADIYGQDALLERALARGYPYPR